MRNIKGWVFDYYAASLGIRAWLIAPNSPERIKLHHHFDLSLYLGGPAHRLRQAWRWWEKKRSRAVSYKVRRRDVFTSDVDGLAVVFGGHHQLTAVFREISSQLPDLTYYDADVSTGIYY